MSANLVVVLDTGVWISGVSFRRGVPAAILRAWRDRRFEVIITPETLGELERKLREKAAQFGAAPTLAEEWIAYVKTLASVVPTIAHVMDVCRDPDDDMFLSAALSGSAEYIVSGDHDLQVLGEYQGIKVLSPRTFAELLGITPPLVLSDDV